MLLIWPVLGVLIGIYAAQKKGFSPVAGAIGRLLLGPLAFLMFFVSGVTRRRTSANIAGATCLRPA